MLKHVMWDLGDTCSTVKNPTRKLPLQLKGLLHRNLTATTLISGNGTGMELLWLLAPDVVCQI